MTIINDQKLGIYVHIPFCVRRCPYCGFYSNVCEDKDISACIHKYLDTVQLELHRRIETGEFDPSDYQVDTIYFGGGTPSLADPKDIADMIGTIKNTFSTDQRMEASGIDMGETKDDSNAHGAFDDRTTLSGDRDNEIEITMEANPGTLSREKLTGFREAGVNRLSIGLQSFDAGVLTTLGRIHTVDDFLRSFAAARAVEFNNINVDLMFAVPGMTMEKWTDTLDRTIELRPEHLSFYSLQIEEGTRFYDDYKAEKLAPLDDSLDRDMYHESIARLKDAGYTHYEISNATKPGFECRHNIKYWRFEDYLGLGASASSFVGGVRTTNVTGDYEQVIGSIADDITSNYISIDDKGEQENISSNVISDHAFAGKKAFSRLYQEYNKNNQSDDMGEYMFTGLRMMDGISRRDFMKRFSMSIEDAFPDAIPELNEFISDGYLADDNGRLCLTKKGIDISNKIMALFV